MKFKIHIRLADAYNKMNKLQLSIG